MIFLSNILRILIENNHPGTVLCRGHQLISMEVRFETYYTGRGLYQF